MTIALMALSLTVNAQENEKKTTIELPQWVKNIKFSGYGMLQYQGQDPEGEHSNTFNLRLARFILDGKIGDFDWRAQIQGTNVKGPGEPTVQMIDLYAEWRRFPEFKIRAGQFKRAYTFENPTNPITQGWYAYANVINNLSGFGDRTGEKSSGGRDIGIQFSGDLFPNASGRRLFHYQIGVYNGEGVNEKDKDNRKDIIGGFWVMPIKGFRIGAFGWTGTRGGMYDPATGNTVSVEKNRYAISAENQKDKDNKKDIIGGVWVMPIKGLRIGAFGWTGTRGELTMTKTDGSTVTIESARKNRYALSAEYDKDEYTFRAEYLHSQGLGAKEMLGDKADGWYAFGIVPVIKSKLHAKARYQTYRDNKEWNRAKTMYEIGCNYYFTKNLQVNLEYARVNDRSLTKHNYNFVDVQFDFRF